MRRTNPKKKEAARLREVARRDPGLEEVLDFVESWSKTSRDRVETLVKSVWVAGVVQW